MCNKNEQVFWRQIKSLGGVVSLCVMVMGSCSALANSAYTYDTQNDVGGDISLTNLADVNPGVQGKSSYQSLILANSEFLYSVQAIERDFYDGDYILHRYDGNDMEEVTRLPFQYDFEVGIPRYITQNNKVVFFAYGTEEDFLVFDGASEDVSLYSLDDQMTQSDRKIFGASTGFAFVGSTYFWGENDGQNIDSVYRLSQDENIKIELAIDRDRPLQQQVVVFSDGVYVKSDAGYILLDNSTSVTELAGFMEAPQYLFEWGNRLVFQESDNDNIVWLDKQNLEVQRFPGHVWGFTRVGEDMQALVEVGAQTQLWTFASDGSLATQNLTFPNQQLFTEIKVNGATSDSIFFVSASDGQTGTSYSWWRLHLATLDASSLTTLSNIYDLRFNSINDTAFLWEGADLWRSEGDGETTQKVTFPDGVTVEGQNTFTFDDSILVASNSSQYGREWLVVDEQGNSQVLDTVPGSVGSGIYSNPGNNIIFKNRFLALQNMPDTGNELYVYQDLESSPALVYDLVPGAIGYDSMPFSLSVDALQNQSMIFVDSLFSDTGKQLFFTDGTPANSGILPAEPNADYRLVGNHYYLKEAQSVSRFNQETQTFDSFITLPEDINYYELLAGHDEWLIYNINRTEPEQKELLISDGNTSKSIFTGNSNYAIVRNGNLYFYHRAETQSQRWQVYRYEIATDELSQLFEVNALNDFKVVDDHELLFTYTEDGHLQVSRLNDNGELIPVFTNPDNKYYEAEYSLFNGKVVLVERDPDLQLYMNKVGIYLLNIATGELEELPISQQLATRQYSINFYIHESVINAGLWHVDTNQRACFLFNQNKIIEKDAYCDIDAFDVGEETLILSARPTSVNRDNFENDAQVFDKNLDLLFEYQTVSTRYRQKRYKLADAGYLYHMGNEQREELWWKGTTQEAPIKIVNDYNEFIENSGLSSLQDVSWQAVNGKLFMRGEEDSIGAEPFVLDLHCQPEMQFITTSVNEDDGNYSLSISPGTTVELEFAMKSMLPLQTEDIQLSDTPGIAMQLTSENGQFTLRLEAASEFTGTQELTLSANGECGAVSATINMTALDSPPTTPPTTNESSGGSSSYWILPLLVLAWLRRLRQFAPCGVSRYYAKY